MPEFLKKIDFEDICSGCRENCCKRFYAILFPFEESGEIALKTNELKTPFRKLLTLGTPGHEKCPFLRTDGLCSIYSKRPIDCRMYPVLVYHDFSKGEKVAFLDLECPAVRSGRVDRSFVESVLQAYKSLQIDEEWLKAYTVAPWPTRLKEVER